MTDPTYRTTFPFQPGDAVRIVRAEGVVRQWRGHYGVVLSTFIGTSREWDTVEVKVFSLDGDKVASFYREEIAPLLPMAGYQR